MGKALQIIKENWTLIASFIIGAILVSFLKFDSCNNKRPNFNRSSYTEAYRKFDKKIKQLQKDSARLEKLFERQTEKISVAEAENNVLVSKYRESEKRFRNAPKTQNCDTVYSNGEEALNDCNDLIAGKDLEIFEKDSLQKLGDKKVLVRDSMLSVERLRVDSLNGEVSNEKEQANFFKNKSRKERIKSGVIGGTFGAALAALGVYFGIKSKK